MLKITQKLEFQMTPTSEASNLKADIENDFEVLSCLLRSASILHELAADKFSKKACGDIDIDSKFLNLGENFSTALFLFRHALELGIKALIMEQTGLDVQGSNIKKMWEDNVKTNDNAFLNKINRAFKVLDSYGLLQDDYIFHFHVPSDRPKLRDLPLITNKSFSILSDAGWAVRNEVIRYIHSKNISNTNLNSATIIEFNKLKSHKKILFDE